MDTDDLTGIAHAARQGMVLTHVTGPQWELIYAQGNTLVQVKSRAIRSLYHYAPNVTQIRNLIQGPLGGWKTY